MGKHFWPIYVAVASISGALVWRFAPAIGARMPAGVRARICDAVESGRAFFSGRSAAADELAEASETARAVAASCAPPEAEQKPVPPAPAARAPDRSPTQRGVHPVDSIHAAWGVLTGVTPVEKLDGTLIGNVAGGRFFKIKDTISTPSGLMVTGTFISQKLPQTVRIPAEKINCLSGAPGFLSTNQQVCLRMYYQLTGEAETLKEKLMRDAAKKSPYLQDAADALRELRAREKAGEKLKRADADTLRKATYEISQLRVKAQELNQKHKAWKAEHAAELPDPEKDPAYLEILERRRRYAEPIKRLVAF